MKHPPTNPTWSFPGQRIRQLLLVVAVILFHLLLTITQDTQAAPSTDQASAPATAATPAPAAPQTVQANLAITITEASSTVIVPGGQIQYTVSLTNTGPNAAQGVQVALNITNPAVYATIAGGNDPSGWGCVTTAAQQTRTCTRSEALPPGVSERFTFLLNPLYVRTYAGANFQASVSTSTEDPDTSNNVATPHDVTVTSAETSADLVADPGTLAPPGPVPPGSLVELFWAGRNAGPATSDYTVVLTSTAGTQIMGVFDAESRCRVNPPIATCLHTGNGAPTATANRSRTIGALLLAPTLPGDYKQYFSVSGVLTDPLPSNNSQDVALNVVTEKVSADLQLVSAEAGPAPAAPGAAVFYTVTVRNNGPDDASQVVLFVPMFPGTTRKLDPSNSLGSIPLTPIGWHCPAAVWGRGWYCTAESMQAGEEAKLFYRLYAPPNAGIYTATLGIGSRTGDPDTANNLGQAMFTVNDSRAPVANLHVTVQNTAQPSVHSGDQIELNFHTSNDGPDNAEAGYVGVTWDYASDKKWFYVSHTEPAGWNCTMRVGYNSGMDCYKANVPSGADDKWSVTLRAPAVTQYMPMRVCVLTTSSNRNDTPVIDNLSPCNIQAVTPISANLHITGDVSPDRVNAGGVLSYTLVVHNDGPDALTPGYPRQLELNVAPGVFFQGLVGADWTVIDTLPPTFHFSFPAIAAGAATTATVLVLAPSITGTITATATVRGPDFDADLNDNQHVFTTSVTLDIQAADLGITLTLPSTLCVGTIGTMTATVNSLGPALAINPNVQITVPLGLALQSATSSDFLCKIDRATSAICKRSKMAVGNSTIIFSVLGLASVSATIQASVSSATPDGKQSNNHSSATTQVNQCVTKCNELAPGSGLAPNQSINLKQKT